MEPHNFSFDSFFVVMNWMNGKYLVGFYVWAVFSCSCVWDLHTRRPAPFTPNTLITSSITSTCLKTQEFHTPALPIVFSVAWRWCSRLNVLEFSTAKNYRLISLKRQTEDPNKHEKNKMSQSTSTLCSNFYQRNDSRFMSGCKLLMKDRPHNPSISVNS